MTDDDMAVLKRAANLLFNLAERGTAGDSSPLSDPTRVSCADTSADLDRIIRRYGGNPHTVTIPGVGDVTRHHIDQPAYRDPVEAIASAVSAAYGWMPLHVRYEAAGLAAAAVDRWMISENVPATTGAAHTHQHTHGSQDGDIVHEHQHNHDGNGDHHNPDRNHPRQHAGYDNGEPNAIIELRPGEWLVHVNDNTRWSADRILHHNGHTQIGFQPLPDTAAPAILEALHNLHKRNPTPHATPTTQTDHDQTAPHATVCDDPACPQREGEAHGH